jgi:hypothetical protein
MIGKNLFNLFVLYKDGKNYASVANGGKYKMLNVLHQQE